MTFIGVDPGPEQSAVVVLRDRDGDISVMDHYIAPNRDVITKLHVGIDIATICDSLAAIAFEQIASMGMAVGEETFETCVWTGRMMQSIYEVNENAPIRRYKRVPIKVHLCGTAQAKDPNVRQALIDRFGGSAAIRRGKAAKVRKGVVVEPEVLPGALCGIASHCWSALAVAVYARDMMRIGN